MLIRLILILILIPLPLNEPLNIPETTPAPRSEKAPAAAAKKHRLASKAQESINMDELGNKAKVNLSLHELFAISSDISSWVAARTKRTRHNFSSPNVSKR